MPKYATIPALENTRVILHREKLRKRHVENPKKLGSEFVHFTDIFGNYAILSNFMAPIKEILKMKRSMKFGKCTLTGLIPKLERVWAS